VKPKRCSYSALPWASSASTFSAASLVDDCSCVDQAADSGLHARACGRRCGMGSEGFHPVGLLHGAPEAVGAFAQFQNAGDGRSATMAAAHRRAAQQAIMESSAAAGSAAFQLAGWRSRDTLRRLHSFRNSSRRLAATRTRYSAVERMSSMGVTSPSNAVRAGWKTFVSTRVRAVLILSDRGVWGRLRGLQRRGGSRG